MAFVSLLKTIDGGIHCFQEDYNEIVERWKAKQSRGASKEQMWGLFIAKKNWHALLLSFVLFYYI